MIADVMREANSRMKGAIASLESDLGAFRTGRASTKLVEHLRVEQYGANRWRIEPNRRVGSGEPPASPIG